MDEKRTRWSPSIDVLVFIVSMTAICFAIWVMAY
jgi:hypothetical protein